MAKKTKKNVPTPVEAYEMQGEYKRPTLPTGEYSGIASEELMGRETPVVKYSLGDGDAPSLDDEFAARDPDLDPQYIWRGKKPNDINELETAAPFIYQQEKIFPRMLIEEMKRQTAIRRADADAQMTLGTFAEDFDPNAKPCFYNHEEGWKNRMILGDSLQVMASLAENERLRGKVQMIYFDPPYGIKFNSNWQPSTKSTNVKDGAVSDITREPEMVKAFRDTWHDGIHSYLGYLRDRLTVARDLLTDSGSVFVQISDDNEHKVRSVLDEVFGEGNFVSIIPFRKKLMPLGSIRLESMCDYLLWYAKDLSEMKYRTLYRMSVPKIESRWTNFEGKDGVRRKLGKDDVFKLDELSRQGRIYRLVSQRAPSFSAANVFDFKLRGMCFSPPKGGCWVTTKDKMTRLKRVNRLECEGDNLSYVYYHSDFPYSKINSFWDDTAPAQGKRYVVQTSNYVIQRCMLMCTDPGDLVLDPTCGSGTTAAVDYD